MESWNWEIQGVQLIFMGTRLAHVLLQCDEDVGLSFAISIPLCIAGFRIAGFPYVVAKKAKAASGMTLPVVIPVA